MGSLWPSSEMLDMRISWVVFCIVPVPSQCTAWSTSWWPSGVCVTRFKSPAKHTVLKNNWKESPWPVLDRFLSGSWWWPTHTAARKSCKSGLECASRTWGSDGKDVWENVWENVWEVGECAPKFFPRSGKSVPIDYARWDLLKSGVFRRRRRLLTSPQSKNMFFRGVWEGLRGPE